MEKDNAVFLASLESPDRRRILDADSQVIVSPDGFLLYARGGALMAQRFDFERRELAGEARLIVPSIDQNRVSRAITASVSNTGVLVYRPGVRALLDLVWIDRTGRRLDAIAAPDHYYQHSLSPDDTRVAVGVQDPASGGDIWLIDLARGTRSRLTRHPASEAFPTWSPDGQQLLFMSNREGPENLYRTRATGVGDEVPVFRSDAAHKHPQQWSADGRHVIFDSINDIWALPLEEGDKPFTVVATEAAEAQPRLSPDGRWIAYTSNETGRSEVYVQPFPPTGAKWPISTSGGGQPRWRADGGELYYLGLDRRLMVVTIERSADFRAGLPQALFVTPLWQVNSATDLGVPDGLYTPAKNGDRFLFLVPLESGRTIPANVITNWTARVTR